MILIKRLQLEAVLFILLGATVGFVFLQAQVLPGPLTFSSRAAIPMQSSMSATPTTKTSSQISSDGTKNVIMNVTENNDGTKTYDITTSDTDSVIYAKLLPPGENLSIPFNTWSANNKYFFIQENTLAGTKILVFNGNGTPFAEGELFIDLTDLFGKSSRRSSHDTFFEATGWAESNLIVINTKKENGSQGASYWFEVPSKSIYRLSTKF